MPGAKKNFIGLEGFIWWIGVVEDRHDPEQLGRVRVRCFGWHTEDKNKIPTESLPWAHPVIPVNNPAAYTPKEGDMVFGFFMDGDSAQRPAIMGVLPGKPEKKPDYQKGFSDPRTSLGSSPNKISDSSEPYPKGKYLKEQTINRLARGNPDSTVIATRKKNKKSGIKSAAGVSWDEPSPAFKPSYPYNNALETESGHALEFDDTPGQERIQLAHRKGSFIEIDKDGSEVHKVVKDNYTLVMGSDYVYVSGRCSVTIGGDCNLKVGGNMNVEVDGGINMSAGKDVRIKGKNVYVESADDMNIKSGGVGNLTSKNKLSLKGGVNATLQGDVIDLPAGVINMQSGSATSASGTGLTGGGSTPSDTDAATAANAISETASTGNGDDQLEEVNITSQKVSATTTADSSAGASVGKAVSGSTSTVSNVFNTIKSGADNTLATINSRLPIGEVQNKLSGFSDTVNNLKGNILSLPDNLKTTLTDKISEVSSAASAKNLEFNVDDSLKTKAVSATKTILGKRLYPSTETLQEIEVTSSQSANNG